MKKIIDGHMHISRWGEEDFISFFDDYREEEKLSAINICSVPIAQSNICNNIMLCFYKLARQNTYIHGGIELNSIPIDNMPKEMNAVSQYKELMEIGFDGIKMLEGKPTEHKRIGKNLNHSELKSLYTEIEKDGTHLIMHVNDPDEFWDKDRAPDWAVENGWAYLDGTFSSYEEIQEQTINILEKHPNIKMTLAHFFFCSKEPQKLENLFSKYPNLCVDLTPGGEMYVSFAENNKYYNKFFNKYSNRLIFGTDISYRCDWKYAKWMFDVITSFVATDITQKAYGEIPLKGVKLPRSKCDEIFYVNFQNRVGKMPKEINKDKLRKYIDKYSFVLTDKDKERIMPLVKKYI